MPLALAERSGSAGVRRANASASTSASSRPAPASSRIGSPSLHPRDRPARRGLRRDVDGRRHLARRAGHAPVGDQRHAEAALLQGAEDRRQRVQLGHAVGLRALEAQHADEIALQRAALERGLHLVLIVEDAGRGLDDVTLRASPPRS